MTNLSPRWAPPRTAGFHDGHVPAHRLVHEATDLVRVDEVVDELRVACLFRQERALGEGRAQSASRDLSAATDVVNEDLLVLVDELLVIVFRDLAAGAQRQLLGGALVRADAYEVGLDPELVERAPEIEIARREAGKAETPRRVDGDAIGLRAGVERTATCIFQVACDLLAVRTQRANRVAQLFGMGQRRSRLVLQDEQHAFDLVVLGEPPEPPEQAEVATHAGRVVDVDAHHALRQRDARLAVASDRRARVEAAVFHAEAVAEQRAARGLQRPPVDVDAGGADELRVAPARVLPRATSDPRGVRKARRKRFVFSCPSPTRS
jgi:hypothetical protein